MSRKIRILWYINTGVTSFRTNICKCKRDECDETKLLKKRKFESLHDLLRLDFKVVL